MAAGRKGNRFRDSQELLGGTTGIRVTKNRPRLPHWTGGALGTGGVSLITWGFSPFTLGVLGNSNGVLGQTSILGPLPPPCYGGTVGP